MRLMECFSGTQPDTTASLSRSLSRLLRRRPVILCVGSDRVTGDCIGPLVGHLLKQRFDVPAFVYGGLDSPVNALNLAETAAFIAARHTEPLLVIDSSVGSREDVGTIRLFSGAVRPGSALGKDLGSVGDVGITATVAPKNSDLGAVRLNLVFNLAETIAAAVATSLSRFHYNNSLLKRQLQEH